MEKRLIYTIADDDSQKYFLDSSYPTFIEYAKKVNADFKVYGSDDYYETFKQTKTRRDEYKWGIVAKIINIKRFLDNNEYDRVFLIDSDMLILNTCPNIFDLIPNGYLAGFDEYYHHDDPKSCKNSISQVYEHTRLYNNVLRDKNMDALNNYTWTGNYLNNALFLLDKETNIFDPPEDLIMTMSYIQDYMNFVIRQKKPKMYILSHRWDHFVVCDKTEQSLKSSFIQHYAGIGIDYKDRCNIMNFYKSKLKNWGLL